MRCYVQIKDTDNASTEKITYLSNWAEFSASCKESNTVPVFILVPPSSRSHSSPSYAPQTKPCKSRPISSVP